MSRTSRYRRFSSLVSKRCYYTIPTGYWLRTVPGARCIAGPRASFFLDRVYARR